MKLATLRDFLSQENKKNPLFTPNHLKQNEGRLNRVNSRDVVVIDDKNEMHGPFDKNVLFGR